ncbi:low complexity protein [Carp edema virus]|nr:low complexity protein [Carp edema virus]
MENTIVPIFDLFKKESAKKELLIKYHPDKNSNANTADTDFILKCNSILNNKSKLEKYKNILSVQNTNDFNIIIHYIKVSINDFYNEEGTSYPITVSYRDICDRCSYLHKFESKSFFMIRDKCTCDDSGFIDKKIKTNFVVNNKTPFNSNFVKLNRLLILVNFKLEESEYAIDAEKGNVVYYTNISHNDYFVGFKKIIKLPNKKYHEVEYSQGQRFINPLVLPNQGIKKRKMNLDKNLVYGDFIIFFVFN